MASDFFCHHLHLLALGNFYNRKRNASFVNASGVDFFARAICQQGHTGNVSDPVSLLLGLILIVLVLLLLLLLPLLLLPLLLLPLPLTVLPVLPVLLLLLSLVQRGSGLDTSCMPIYSLLN